VKTSSTVSTELPPVEQAVLHEVHAPPLVRARGEAGKDAQRAAPLLALSPLYTEVFQLVETVDPLDVDLPALAPEQRVEVRTANARPRSGELAKALPERRLVLRVWSFALLRQ
jgi:hypothetical protein